MPRPRAQAVVEVDRIGNEQDRSVHIVMHGHVRHEVQGHLRQLQIVLGRGGQALPVAHCFPAEEAHQAGREGRQAFKTVGLQCRDGVADGFHGVAGRRDTHRRLADPVRVSVFGGQGGAGLGTNEGVTGP